MNKNPFFDRLLNPRFSVLWLLIGASTAVFLSPRINIGLFAWISPLAILIFFRLGSIRKKWLWFVPAMTLVTVISLYEAIPFPFPVLVVIALASSLVMALIFQLDRWLFQKTNHFLVTLFLPAAMVTREFIDAQGGGGVWSSIANSQVHFSWLIQLASVTGIFGISFMIYWFASVGAWVINKTTRRENFKTGAVVYGLIFFGILLFGFLRCEIVPGEKPALTRIGGVSVPPFNFIESLYEDYSGVRKKLDPKSSLTSSTFAEMRAAYIPFIETADTIRFHRGYVAMKLMQDSLFALSEKAAKAGAKIISWSEANAMVLPFDEEHLIRCGKTFASKNQVWLLMAIAVILPGKITAERKFLENKALLIGPDGMISNVLHKNKPVHMAESSEPGDGRIPAIETRFGRISTSICYDADFPGLMQQLGQLKTGLLLLPSGDWWAISPFHSYMALFRGIENGSSVFRQASGGLSVASDYTGKILGSMDFYQEGEKCWWIDMPIQHVPTIYSSFGNSFDYACMFLAFLGVGLVILKWRTRNE